MGSGTLLWFRKLIDERGGTLGLFGLKPSVAESFRAFRLYSFFLSVTGAPVIRHPGRIRATGWKKDVFVAVVAAAVLAGLLALHFFF